MLELLLTKFENGSTLRVAFLVSFTLQSYVFVPSVTRLGEEYGYVFRRHDRPQNLPLHFRKP